MVDDRPDNRETMEMLLTTYGTPSNWRRTATRQSRRPLHQGIYAGTDGRSTLVSIRARRAHRAESHPTSDPLSG